MAISPVSIDSRKGVLCFFSGGIGLDIEFLDFVQSRGRGGGEHRTADANVGCLLKTIDSGTKYIDRNGRTLSTNTSLPPLSPLVEISKKKKKQSSAIQQL